MEERDFKGLIEDQLFKDPSVRDTAAVNVAKYLDPTSKFAAYSFDLEGANPPFEICNDDILAVSFLDTPIRAGAFRRIKSEPKIHELLLRIDPEACLWHFEPKGALYEYADQLWNILNAIPGLGPTRVSKIMARKRPNLIPIRDKRVVDFYAGYTSWLALGQTLRDVGLREKIDSLRPQTRQASLLSLIRILDIAVWMQGGKSGGNIPGGQVPSDDDD